MTIFDYCKHQSPLWMHSVHVRQSTSGVRLFTKEKGSEGCFVQLFISWYKVQGIIYSILLKTFNEQWFKNILSLKHVILLIYLFILNRSRGLGQKWFPCSENSVYWRKDTVRLHTLRRPTFTAEQCSDVDQRQETPPLLPLRPGLDFHFPPVDPVTICLLAVSSTWGEVMVTDPLFVPHMSPQQLPRQFFSYHSVLNQNLLLNCPLSSQISYTDWALVSHNIHVLVTL